MATLETSKLFIAGIGHVYVADVDTEPMDVTAFKFDPSKETTGGWRWLGDTSSENLIEFSTDGGDATFKRTWDRLKTSVVYADTTITATINSVNVGPDTIKLAFPSAKYDEGTDSYSIDGLGSSEKAIQIVMEDGQTTASLYFGRTSLSGSFPSFGIEDYTEIPLSCNMLNSDKTRELFRWFAPRTRSLPAAPVVGGGN